MGLTIFRPGRRVVIPSPGVQVWTPGVASAAFTGVLDGISNVVAPVPSAVKDVYFRGMYRNKFRGMR